MKKKLLIGIASFCFLCFSNVSFAQKLPVEGILDQALALSKQGNQSEMADALNMGVAALKKEANVGNGDLKSKLLGQVGNLQALIPLANQGNLKTDMLGKAVNTVKTLVAANRISNLLSGGKSNLLSNATSLTSNLGLLQTGMSVLGGGGIQDQLSGLIGGATKNISKFDSKGFLGIGGGKCAASAASKKLGSIVQLVSGAF